MRNIQFAPECFAETEMVKNIFDVQESDYLNHGEGIHNVSSILRKKDIRNFLNVGFIDNDKKNTPPYFDNFKIIEEHINVIFKKHSETNDYLIIVKPAMELFILSQLKEIGKSPSDYNLPDDFKEFRKKLKKTNIQYNEGYKKLLIDLRNSKASGIEFIISEISKLRTL